MDLVLKRKQYRNDGIFGELLDPAGRIVAFTLEHAYFDGQSYVPKIPIGKWQCKLGEHRLAHMTEPFSTFEVTGVEGHTDLLFHSGNRNADSAGCILLGSTIAGGRGNGEHALITPPQPRRAPPA